MGALKEFFSFIRSGRNNDLNNHIYYKIVDSTQKEYCYALQCINTKAVFHAEINDIIFDLDLLHGLHPIQACYIGLEYSKYLKNLNGELQSSTGKTKDIASYSCSRYGSCNLLYQDRKGNICFFSKNDNQEYLLDPRDIALSEELIREFDAAQAFYIGLTAGFKIHNPIKRQPIKSSPPHLRIVR